MSEIICDVDGVVFDMVGHLFQTMRLKGVAIDSPDDGMSLGNKWDLWNIFDVMSDEQRECAMSIMSDTNFWETGGLVEGATESISNLRQLGHHIHWVTSPWISCRGWYDARHAWLNRNFGCDLQDLSVDLTVAGNKSVIHADILIDDKTKNVVDWKSRHPNGCALLYKTPHNRMSSLGLGLDELTWEPDGSIKNGGYFGFKKD